MFRWNGDENFMKIKNNFMKQVKHEMKPIIQYGGIITSYLNPKMVFM